MASDEREERGIALAKQLVTLIQVEHPELPERVILRRIREIWQQLVAAVVAGDEAEAAIVASRVPPLSPAARERWRSIWVELYPLLGDETAGDD